MKSKFIINIFYIYNYSSEINYFKCNKLGLPRLLKVDNIPNLVERVHHGANEFVRGNSHINGIESFWSYAKVRLVKFHGMDKTTFNLHLKKCEFRFNNRGQDLYKLLLKIFRNEPLN